MTHYERFCVSVQKIGDDYQYTYKVARVEIQMYRQDYDIITSNVKSNSECSAMVHWCSGVFQFPRLQKKIPSFVDLNFK